MNQNIIELADVSSYTLTKCWLYDWAAIEADLGIALPREYEDYVTYFPPGAHGGVITPVHPAIREGSLSFHERILLMAGLLRDAMPAAGAEPAAYFPDAGGFIPWAMYGSVVALCWLPEGDDSSRWPLFACDDQHQRESATPNSQMGIQAEKH